MRLRTNAKLIAFSRINRVGYDILSFLPAQYGRKVTVHILPHRESDVMRCNIVDVHPARQLLYDAARRDAPTAHHECRPRLLFTRQIRL